MLTYPTPVIQPHKSLRPLQILQSHSVSLLFISHASFLIFKADYHIPAVSLSDLLQQNSWIGDKR